MSSAVGGRLALNQIAVRVYVSIIVNIWRIQTLAYQALMRYRESRPTLFSPGFALQAAVAFRAVSGFSQGSRGMAPN